MATVTTRRRPSGTSGLGCPDSCPPRLFSEPSGPETELSFSFSLSSGCEVCRGDWVALPSPFQRGLSLHTAAREPLLLSPASSLLLGLITGSVLCCVGGKDWRFWFLLCELYLRTFFFIGGSMALAACTRSLLYTFNQTLFQTKGRDRKSVV